MVAPTISTDFQIGVDNAMIQVPQFYTVPANPPSIPNPPTSVVVSTTTAGTTATVIQDTSLSLAINVLKGGTLFFAVGPINQYRVITGNTATTITVNPAFSPAPADHGQVYEVMPSTNTATAKTNDSVTVYVSAIKGFAHTLTMSFFIRRIDTTVDPDLPPLDATTAPWQGLIGSIPTPSLPSYDMIPAGAYDPTNNGWEGLFQFVLTPSTPTTNPLNTYEATNYKTLCINPQNTGGAIDPNHPPSYQVNIYAVDDFDILHPKYAACSFTLVVLPSVANYGLGVYERITNTNGDPTFGNSVALKKDGHAIGNYVDVIFNFYPLETTALIPNAAPAPVTVTLDVFNDQIIDKTNSTIVAPTLGGPVALGTYMSNPPAIGGVNALPSGFTRESPAGNVSIRLYLYPDTSPPLPAGYVYPIHTLLKLTGTDSNGVSASAYVIIQVVSS